MNTLNITWLYPDLLNLHGDRGNLMAFERVGKEMGLDVQINRVDTFSEEIDFKNSDIIFMNAGEIKTADAIVKNIKKYGDAIYNFAESGKPIIAIGTTGMVLIKSTKRCDGSVVEGLGLLDATAVERNEIYGKGNNDKDQTEGAKYKNVIFTNALGPVFVKNPWYTEKIINEALKAKGCEPCEPLDESFFEIERNSFKTVRRFIDQKTEK